MEPVKESSSLEQRRRVSRLSLTMTTCPYAMALQGSANGSDSDDPANDSRPRPIRKGSHSTMGSNHYQADSTNETSINHHHYDHHSARLDLLDAVRHCPAFEKGSCPFRGAQTAQEIQQTLLQIPRSHFLDDHLQSSVSSTEHPDGSNMSSSSSSSSSRPFLEVLKELHQVQAQLQQQKQAEHEGQQADQSKRAAAVLEEASFFLDTPLESEPSNDNSHDAAAQQKRLSSSFTIPGGCPVQKFLIASHHPPQRTKASAIMNDTSSLPNNHPISFTQAIEGWSLAAIMAGMAQDMECDNDEDESDGKVVIMDMSSAETNEDVTGIRNEVAPSPAVIRMSATMEQNDDEQVFPVGFREAKSLSTSDQCTPTSKTNYGNTQRRVSLSESLKTGTAASHEAAENVHFVRNFIHGKIDRHLYGQLIVMLYHVYVVLEECLDAHAKQANFATCHFPHELQRTPSLLEDMDFWHGHVVEECSPATADYVQRLYHLAQQDPLLLLAHAYTRYLGDLSGGRILGRVARKALNLDHRTTTIAQGGGKAITEGLTFYHFEHVPSIKLFKDQYRRSLDALELSSDQIDRLVAEANVAFYLNMRLFEELDVMANIPGAKVRSLDETLAMAATGGSSNNESRNIGQDQASSSMLLSPAPAGANTGACPFAQLGNNSNGNNKCTSADTQQPANSSSTKSCPFAKLGENSTQAALSLPSQECAFAKYSNNKSGNSTGSSPLSSRGAMEGGMTLLISSSSSHNKRRDDTTKPSRCPWPFIFFHDPVQGLRDWQTWAFIIALLPVSWFVVIWLQQQHQQHFSMED